MTDEAQGAVVAAHITDDLGVSLPEKGVFILIPFIILSIYPILVLTSAFVPSLQDFLGERVEYGILGALTTLLAAGLLELRHRRLREDMNYVARQIANVNLNATEVAIRVESVSELAPLVSALNEQLSTVRVHRRRSFVFNASNRVIARKLQRFMSLLDSMNEGVLILDNSGKIAFANEEMNRFLSCAGSEASGAHYSDCVINSALLQLIDEGMSDENLSGVRTEDFESEIDGNTQFLQVRSSFGYIGNQIPVGRILLVRDITKAKAMDSLQVNFVDGVVHELRSPLTSILGYVEMLVDGSAPDEETQRDFYNIIYGETYRLSNLIDNLLNMSNIEGGAVKLNPSPTRLAKFIDDGLDAIRPQCEQNGVELISELPERLPTIDVDKDLFKIIITNLLSNAAKYTPPGGRIYISFESGIDEITLSIRDTGIGISESDLPHIFEKFYRSDSNESSSIHGSGVGLSIALMIVKLHDGDIRVKSVPNEGTTFAIVLPRSVVNMSIGE